MVIGSKRAGTILQTGIYQAWNGGIPGLKPGVNRFRTGVYQVPKGGVRGGWGRAGRRSQLLGDATHTHLYLIPLTHSPLSTVTRGSGSGRAQCGTGHRGAHRGAGAGTRGGHKKPLGLSVLRWFTSKGVVVLIHRTRTRPYTAQEVPAGVCFSPPAAHPH